MSTGGFPGLWRRRLARCYIFWLVAKTLALIYGLASYALFLATFFYAIGFVGNLAVPKSIDSGDESAVGQALFINLVLISLFVLQHSVMVRRGFKRWWTKKIVPRPLQRSTYVLISNLLLALLFWQWRPMTAIVWEVGHPDAQRLLEILFWLGWLIALHSTFLIDHAALFGLRQVYLYVRDRERAAPKFRMPELYQYVRHPIMMGFLIAFWATPVMTLGHLLFALGATLYILIGIWLEERDLTRLFGEAYREYRRRVWMLLPLPRKRPKGEE